MNASIVALQHRLPSLALLRAALADGGPGELKVLVGKPYSTIPEPPDHNWDGAEILDDAEDIDWHTLARPILVLDEGGALHGRVPEALAPRSAGVEQTSSGYQDRWRYPVSLVCRSAAKLLFESQIIARGLLRKLESLDLLDGRPVGVIGLGALGGEIARRLLARGLPVVGFDLRRIRDELDMRQSLTELLAQAELILGCSGHDALGDADLLGLTGRKVFASCSSGAWEFRRLLERLPTGPIFADRTGQLGDCTVTVLNGGFPINFDRCREWELPGEIVLTRWLCVEGLVQAGQLVGSRPRGVMLPPSRQLHVVQRWLEQVPDRHDLRIPGDLDASFFLSASEGEFCMTGKPDYHLHETTPDALASMRAHTAPYETNVLSRSLVVLPDVWSPAYDWSSLFYVENFPAVDGLDFLEIGSGTGVISTFAGLRGARRVVAVDVSEAAVRNTRLNFERHRVEQGEAFISDGFSAVRGQFDVITWNAPYHGARPADMLERGCTDEGYRDIRGFFRDVGPHLRPGGLVVFGFSESGDLPLIRQLIADAGFRIRRELSDWRKGYNCMLFDLTLEPKQGAETAAAGNTR